MKSLHITEEESGQRLDKYLAKYMNLASKSFLYKMLRKKNIKLNGKKAIGNEILHVKDIVTLFLAEETIDKFSRKRLAWNPDLDGELTILYENKHVILIDKPVGMLSQKAKRDDISIIEHLGAYLEKTEQLSAGDGRVFSPGVCNRLDRNTSGVIAAGKTLRGLQMMSELLRERKVKKYYLCIVSGRMENGGRLEGYLYKEESSNKVTVYSDQEAGRNADCERILTVYEPIVSNGIYTLVKVQLVTGKSHQIRAHLSSIGHPVIGDRKYGIPAVNETVKKKFGLRYQLLHSYEMVFEQVPSLLADLENKTIQAPIPPLFEKIMAAEKEKYGNVEF